MQEINGAEAFAGALRNRHRRFPGRDDARARHGALFPALMPGFRLAPGAGVFTIGSCFARNVEEALIARGMQVPTAAFTAPQPEAPGRPNRLLNQYNPGTMLQCLSQDIPPAAALYPADKDHVQDGLLATGGRAVPLPRAQERREQIGALYRDGLTTCDTVVITLGLAEAWFDHADQLYLNEAPPRRLLTAVPDRFALRRLEVADCQDLLGRMLDHLARPGRQVLLTVSPVPMQATFWGGDAICRNAWSKAVLRIAADQAARDFGFVDYFPSYEMITSAGLSAFGEDHVHVRPTVVDRVVQTMLDAYAPEPSSKNVAKDVPGGTAG